MSCLDAVWAYGLGHSLDHVDGDKKCAGEHGGIRSEIFRAVGGNACHHPHLRGHVSGASGERRVLRASAHSFL